MLNLSDLKKIVIVGGGTAGWMSPLYMRKLFPSSKITLLESDKVSTIGVGEGTYRNFRYLLDYLELEEDDFMKETRASLKLGIRYKNWCQDNKEFIHFFS